MSRKKRECGLSDDQVEERVEAALKHRCGRAVEKALLYPDYKLQVPVDVVHLLSEADRLDGTRSGWKRLAIDVLREGAVELLRERLTVAVRQGRKVHTVTEVEAASA